MTVGRTGFAIARTAAWALGFGALVGGLLAIRSGNFWASWAISSAYAVAISAPATLVFRRLGPRLRDRSALAQWATYAGAMLAICVVAVLVVGGALVVIGAVPRDALWQRYVVAFEIALMIAIPMLIGAVSLAQVRGRLAVREAELARAHALAAEAQLASLESRIRPHFLFNALNSAIALIPEDPRRAEAVLERLASLLRFSLDAHGRGVVTLGDELRVVRDYLEIERVRFGDRLRFSVDAADALVGLEVPAFAVQTLVENSVKYAVSARAGGAAIAVTARRDGDRLAIDVRDDGPGFTGEIWRPGHGLDGLRARLRALYGEGARLVAPAAAADGGAAVTLEVPA